MKRLLLLATIALLGCTEQNPKLKLIEEHTESIHIKSGWIRDPYITIGPDNLYYLTGTTPQPGTDEEAIDPYNTGLGDASIVGSRVQIWRSSDLVEWESLGDPYGLEETYEALDKEYDPQALNVLWAPEIHWLGDRWALVHCPSGVSTIALSKGNDLSEWEHISPQNFLKNHDPSLFIDDDNTIYLLSGNTSIAPLKADLSAPAAPKMRIDPSDRRIGHEGATIRKIGDKYVHFGTAWSTDKMRQGSYNLYYCTADKITGPYSERRFAGRFLGHGTPFQDKAGRWWCTAFFNGNTPPLETDGIESRDLGETAQTINQLGTTIVPLEVKILDDGDIFIRAIDSHYRNPGPDEAQQFEIL